MGGLWCWILRWRFVSSAIILKMVSIYFSISIREGTCPTTFVRNPKLTLFIRGVKQIKTSTLSARYIFIAPPSMTVLESRLRGRGTEKEESIQKRLQQAKNEMEYSKTDGVHDLIIVNDDLENAYKELEEFIFTPRTQEQGAKDESKAGVSVQD
jgi:guanylate kinase